MASEYLHYRMFQLMKQEETSSLQIDSLVLELVTKLFNRDQEWKDADGNFMRWLFSDITSDSFRWYGERSPSGKNNWGLENGTHRQKKRSITYKI